MEQWRRRRGVREFRAASAAPRSPDAIAGEWKHERRAQWRDAQVERWALRACLRHLFWTHARPAAPRAECCARTQPRCVYVPELHAVHVAATRHLLLARGRQDDGEPGFI